MTNPANQIIINDITLALQVMGKIFSGLFLSPEAIITYVVFGIGFLIFWAKSKLEA